MRSASICSLRRLTEGVSAAKPSEEDIMLSVGSYGRLHAPLTYRMSGRALGRLAQLEAALEAFFKRREGAVDGVHPDGHGEVHALVWSTNVPGHCPARQRLLDPEQRRIVRHRSFGAARHRHPGGDEALDREHRVGAGAAVV